VKSQFWAVRWGTWEGSVIRISDKVQSAAEACKNTFGLVARGMYVAPLGTTKAQVRAALRNDLAKRTDWKPCGRQEGAF
jgi:hypothetical protein